MKILRISLYFLLMGTIFFQDLHPLDLTNLVRNIDNLPLLVRIIGAPVLLVGGGIFYSKSVHWAFYESGPKQYAGVAILGATAVGVVFVTGYLAKYSLGF